MAEKFLHIVCLDAPSPPNYGGTIDLFYKIPALHADGWRIHLHYFAYQPGRGAEGLETYCESINAYSRSGFGGSVLAGQPYIVFSRCHRGLINRLNEDNHPVLLEGIHCTGLIPSLSTGRVIHVRVHNDEAKYYQKLAEHEKNFFKKMYFKREAKLLAKWQGKLPPGLSYSFVSKEDEQQFRNNYRLTQTSFIPVFIPWQTIQISEGLGTYALYHGNLTISENIQACEWLLREVAPESGVKLIIAGKGASRFQSANMVQSIESPDDDTLHKLISNAQVHVLPSFNATGLKLKLLNALFNGRHSLVNTPAVAGSGLAELVTVADDLEDYKALLIKLMHQPFDQKELTKRKALLGLYDNYGNAKLLSKVLQSI